MPSGIVELERASAEQVVVKSQILAGGRGLGKFKSGLQGGVHICSVDEAPKLAEQMLGQVGADPISTSVKGPALLGSAHYGLQS